MILGYVKKLTSKDGKSKKPPYKPWTLYSMIMENQDGSESGWISIGFDRPSFTEGQWANYETEATERGLNLKAFEKAEAPKTPVAVPSTNAPARSSAHVDRNDSIVYQSSRKDAIAAIGLLLEHNGLPMSASAAKAGQAARYEEITAMIDKLTVQYFRDVQTGRVLESVVDAGAEDDLSEVASADASVDDA